MIEVEYSSVSRGLAKGVHHLVVENRHSPVSSVYQVNALQPKSLTVRILRQNRNVNQSTAEIVFTVDPPVNSAGTKGTLIAGVGVGLCAILAAGGVTIWRKRFRDRG